MKEADQRDALLDALDDAVLTACKKRSGRGTDCTVHTLSSFVVHHSRLGHGRLCLQAVQVTRRFPQEETGHIHRRSTLIDNDLFLSLQSLAHKSQKPCLHTAGIYCCEKSCRVYLFNHMSALFVCQEVLEEERPWLPRYQDYLPSPKLLYKTGGSWKPRRAPLPVHRKLCPTDLS